jgi:O-antigen ligase
MLRVPLAARTVACAVLLACGLAYASPPAFGLAIAAAAAAAVVLLTFLHPAAAASLWLLAVAVTPDMWLQDLVPGAGEAVIAALKLAGVALAAVCALRFGAAADWCNPALPFLAMFAGGLAHGLPPELSTGESLRSLVGSMAPFAFSFSRLSRDWCEAVLRTVRWLPLLVAAFGAALNLAGLHRLVALQDGARLAGAGHPAFMAAFALAGAYACLLELLRRGRGGDLALLCANLALLVLTGARAPTAIGAAVVGLSLLFARSPAYPMRRRAKVLAAGAIAACALVPAVSQLTSLRLFNALDNDAGGLSGRAEIWPLFEAARDASPWVGWGTGAGKVLVSEDSLLAHLLGTTAAHNEYLRIGVDGGWIGVGLLVAAFVLWTWRHTRGVLASDALVMRLALAGSAIHAYTDNTLIATTASVMFAFVSAAFARGRLETRVS